MPARAAARYPRTRLRDGMSGAAYNEYVAEQMHEDVWQARVVAELAAAGFERSLVYHTWRSDHSAKGFPDLFCLRIDHDGVLLWIAELKRYGQEPTPEQWLWLRALGTMRDMIAGRVPGFRMVVGWWQPKQLDELRETLR